MRPRGFESKMAVALDPKQVRRSTVRVEFHVIVRPPPGIAMPGEQVVHDEGLVPPEPERGHVELGPTGMCVLRMEVHYPQNDVSVIQGALAVTEQHVVGATVARKALMRLQREVRATDRVERAKQRGEAVGAVDAPRLDLVDRKSTRLNS